MELCKLFSPKAIVHREGFKMLVTEVVESVEELGELKPVKWTSAKKK